MNFTPCSHNSDNLISLHSYPLEPRFDTAHNWPKLTKID